MADTKYPTLRPELIAGDLQITIWPDSCAEYVGTRAQLEAEGLIPDGFEWPNAAADVRWQADGFDYWLRRTRPEGLRGPMRAWMEMDNWFVRVHVTGRDHSWQNHRAIERKRDELLKEIHSQSEAGRREWHENYEAHRRAQEDKAFQQFKSSFVPERRKPGRPSKRDSTPAIK